MREHHLSVTTLEEYEPNREFVGRNFNAGEVVQLVLKSPSTGRWLPFHYVQMVMMHEYAAAAPPGTRCGAGAGDCLLTHARIPGWRIASR